MSWLDQVRNGLLTARKSLPDVSADTALQGSMAAAIELAGSRYAVDPGAQWTPGEPLKLLLAGYTGVRNTGADVRVEAMIHQFRHLLGDDLLDLSILTIDPQGSRGYFKTVKQLHFPKIFPKFLYDTVHQQHGVIACEGSMFKSKFANALSTLMVGALGLAAVENKFAIGYGGEAGNMDPSLETLVRRYCRDVHVIARNDASCEVLAELGITAERGTDTAWTFEPAPANVGRKLLEDAGWDGHTPVLAVCPINPFWWPVKPDVVKGALRLTSGLYEDDHYASVYFHNSGPEVDAAQARYIDAIAQAVTRYRSENSVFVVLVGMEQLDRQACTQLDEALGGRTPMFISDEHDMYAMVSMLRQCSGMLSSRYHAMVCSMPGLVPSAGITMDERIRNLMADRGQPHLVAEVDDPDLADRAYEMLVALGEDDVREGIRTCVVDNLVRMGGMGMAFVDQLRTFHPDLPLRDGLGRGGDPWDHLPPLNPQLRALVEGLEHRAAQ